MTREQKLEKALREARPRIADLARSWEAEAQLIVRIDEALATPPDTDTRVVSVELLRNAMTEWSDTCDAAEEEYGGYTPLDRSYIAKIRAIIEGKDQ